MNSAEKLYKPGDIVYAKKAPHVKLIVRRYESETIFCRVHNHPQYIEQSHDEAELMPSINPTERNRR